MKDKYTGDLFAKDLKLCLHKLRNYDVLKRTDRFKLFAETIFQHQDMYPGIDRWLKTKVLPGLCDSSRSAYLLLKDDVPVATAVVKLGENAKFCHLHISENIRENYIGNMFFTLMTLDVKRYAKNIHFTLPEHLWTEKNDFFKSFGFKDAKPVFKQYRNNEGEFRCTADFKTVWMQALNKLPQIIESLSNSDDNIFNGILMSIKPAFLNKILSGEKIIEIRKNFSHKWKDRRVTLYSTRPQSAIVGYADIIDTVQAHPDDIWRTYHELLGCSKGEFEEYSSNSAKIFAITLGNCEKFTAEIPLDQLSFLLNKELRPPQSYTSIENSTDWKLGVSIAELLHGRFRLYESSFT